MESKSEYSYSPPNEAVPPQEPEASAFAQAAPDAPAAVRQPVRRVGTLTMGLALIAGGVLALVALLWQDYGIISVLRFSPLILVLLGLEIVVNAAVFRGQKLQYDVLSMFVCFFLIVGAVGASALPAIYRNWGPPRHSMERSIEISMNTLLADALQSIPDVLDADADVYLERPDLQYTENATYGNLVPTDYVYLNVHLGGPYADQKAFATACRTVLDSLSTLPVHARGVRLTYRPGDADEYELTVNTPLLWKQDVEQLAKLVSSDAGERRELEMEREQLYAELATEREQLQQEREEMRTQLQAERTELNAQLQAEREVLQQEREEMNAKVNEERAELSEERAELSEARAS